MKRTTLIVIVSLLLSIGVARAEVIVIDQNPDVPVPAPLSHIQFVFNVPVEAYSSPSDLLVLSQGSATAISFIAGFNVVDFTLTGVTQPGLLTFTIPAGSFFSVYGINDSNAQYNGTLELTGAVVPEPVTMLLLGLGIAGLAGVRRYNQ